MRFIISQKQANRGIDDYEYKKLKHFLSRYNYVSAEGKLNLGNMPKYDQAVRD